VSATHQIHTHRLPRADQITQRLLLEPRHPDRVQLACKQQPDQQLGVTTVGLDPVPRRPRDLARRRDHTLHATLRELTRQPVTGRARLIRSTHRPRQPSTERRRVPSITVHPEHPQLTALSIEHRRDDFRRVHVQADQGLVLAFAMAGSSYSVVGPPHGCNHAARTSTHNRRGGTGHFYIKDRTALTPYGPDDAVGLLTPALRLRQDAGTQLGPILASGVGEEQRPRVTAAFSVSGSASGLLMLS